MWQGTTLPFLLRHRQSHGYVEPCPVPISQIEWQARELFRTRDTDINFYFTLRDGIVQRSWPRPSHNGVGCHIHTVRHSRSNPWSLCPTWSWHCKPCNYIWPPATWRRCMATLQSQTTARKALSLVGGVCDLRASLAELQLITFSIC
jgi:hypothetical protein